MGGEEPMDGWFNSHITMYKPEAQAQTHEALNKLEAWTRDKCGESAGSIGQAKPPSTLELLRNERDCVVRRLGDLGSRLAELREAIHAIECVPELEKTLALIRRVL